MTIERAGIYGEDKMLSTRLVIEHNTVDDTFKPCKPAYSLITAIHSLNDYSLNDYSLKIIV